MNLRQFFRNLLEALLGIAGLIVLVGIGWLLTHPLRPRTAIESLRTAVGRAERARVIREVVASIIWKSPADTLSVYVFSENPNDEEREWERFGERRRIPGGKLAFADILRGREGESGSVIFLVLFKANQDGNFVRAPLAKYTLTLIFQGGQWQLEKLSRNEIPTPTKKGGSPVINIIAGLLFFI